MNAFLVLLHLSLLHSKGARIFRVHNVKEAAQAFTVFEAVL